jgi:hypothetical protein
LDDDIWSGGRRSGRLLALGRRQDQGSERHNETDTNDHEHFPN